ncbi:MAG: 7-carboxy-7-deazaguanine synthase QueE [Cyanobacteriota bacterium]|nr:7-carboxy-7-deazaguanine synthase QueE [Cyanobacteriota bacterium]
MDEEARVSAALPVVETFHSLQGEGCHSGRSAFFIRLGGCNVGCRWCDTKHSWPMQQHPVRSLQALAEEAQKAADAGAGFVVITGGEPLHHNLDPLCQALATVQTTGQRAIPVHLETSGVDPLSGRFEWITLSPKPHRPPTAELLGACHELKVVVSSADDLIFAQAMAQATQSERRQSPAVLLLQPAWGDASATALTLEHVRRHPIWGLSLQTHKWLDIR